MTCDIAKYVRHLTPTLRMTCHAKKKKHTHTRIFMQIVNNAKRSKAWG